MIYFIDFEFTASAEKDVDVVCAVLRSESGDSSSHWLFRDTTARQNFKLIMKKLEGATLVAYAATAECRALRSLGIDPLLYEWIDLYVEWLQLKNKNDRFNFGWVKDSNGQILESKPHHIFHHCHTKTGNSLIDCALRLLRVNIDSENKRQMRDLILSKSHDASSFSGSEKDAVLKYCHDDVTYLPQIYEKMNLFYEKVFEMDRSTIMKSRGRYIATLSNCEHIGTPVNVDALSAISANYKNISSDIYTSMNCVFPLYERQKNEEFVFKNQNFANLIKNLKLEKEWPKTDSGLFSTESETIEQYRHHPKIEKFYQSKKAISSLRAIKGDSKDKLMDRIGRDDRLRSFFGPFGTQTGRNAAKASTFILAMSNWLRVLMTPPLGLSITSVDYSSQEFAIGAALSNDKNMKAAYLSGDPYLYFAKEAGAIPSHGTRHEFPRERDLFKQTTLGLQYGMGIKSLAQKLTQDLGRVVSEEEAKELINLHQEVFPTFWAWIDYCWLRYRREGSLETKDGWVLFGDNTNSLSVKNFMIQGTGASIMRRAVVLATEAGLHVIAPLHDALYIIHNDNDISSVELLKNCMTKASQEFIDIQIRMDTKTYNSKSPWVEEKSRGDYQLFKKYLKI